MTCVGDYGIESLYTRDIYRQEERICINGRLENGFMY